MSFRVKRTGYNEAMHSLDRLIGSMPMTRKNILNEAADLFVKTAKPRIHHITHKTEKSTKKDRVTDKYAIVHSGFGAPHEETRKGAKHGTSHMFMTYAATVVHKQFPMIIKKHVDDTLRKSRSNVR